MSWIKESNRPKHLLYAIPAGVLLTILFVAGLRQEWNSRINNGAANGTGWILLRH